MSLTGIRRGQGWRPVPNTLAGDIPAVVRYLAADEQGRPFRLLGSGAVIGSVEGRWLITATAAEIFQGVTLGESQAGGANLNRRYGWEALQGLRCALTVPERNGELLSRLGGATISQVIGVRDTALVFVGLPQPMQVGVLPLDLGPAPAPDEALLVAGFGAAPAVPDAAAAVGAPDVPARRLLVREGFFGDFGATTGRLRYPLFRHLIPLEPTMLGGPVIVHRDTQPGAAVRTLVAINSQNVPQVSADASLRPELEGEGFATHALALYAHEVLLPSGSWIALLDAVMRGVVSSYGPEARRVARRPGGRDVSQFYIER